MEYTSSQYAIHFTLPDGSVFVVDVNDDSYRYQEMMGKDELLLMFSLPEKKDFPIGTRCTFQGQEYSLMSPHGLKVVNLRNYEYTLVLESYRSVLGKYLVRNIVDCRLQFDLTARPSEHLQQIIDNLNERDSGWSIGVCIDSDEKLITYNHTRCSEALSSIADTFGTEFEINGKVISLHKVEYFKDSPLEMSYGLGNGFKSGITRSNYDYSLPVERLFVQGGSRNIDRSRYALDANGKNGSANLLLPPAGTVLSFDGTRFSDEPGFRREGSRTYIVGSDRLSILRADKPQSTYNEDSIDCSSIYPHRVGTVSNVKYLYHGTWYTYDELIAANPGLESSDWNKEESILVDFYDSGIEEGLDYESCKVAGESQTVIFQSGMLAGKEFNISKYHTDTKRFELVRADIDGVLMPSNIYRLSPGDRYVIFNCTMPLSYYEQAELAMFKEAIRYFYEHEDLKFTFTGEMDGIWAKHDWPNICGKIRTGAYILFNDIDLVESSSHMVRIQSVKQYVNNPHSPVITLSNEPMMSISTVGGALKSLDDESVHIDSVINSTKNYARRSFKQAKETMSMLQGAIDGFASGITPVTVQTMQLLAGAEELQFRFVRSLTNMGVVDCPVYWDSTDKALKSSASFIQHMTMGLSGSAVQPSSSRTYSDYRRWSLPSFESTSLADLPDTPFYIYAIVSKSGTSGSFALSETKRSLNFNSDYYALLVGILSSEVDGIRSFARLYGYTEILPGEITTDLIKGSDGASWWNLLTNAVSLGGKLKYNVEGDRKLVLDGTLVQTGAGEVPIGGYCGAYDPNRTYQLNDEVSYSNNGLTSSYRYVNSVPSKGHAPTDINYWIVVAEGKKGDKGDNSYSPYIGTNGNWFIYDDTQKKYVDSGRTSEGDDGHSPYIKDGYWYEWDNAQGKYTNTNIKAKGDKGDPGSPGAPGAPGSPGSPGNGISGTTISYGISSSSTAQPTTWYDSPSKITFVAGYYVWTRTVTSYTNGTSSTSYSVARQGSNGQPGGTGAKGDAGPAAPYQGEYSSSKLYYGTARRCDIVHYNGQYYIALATVGRSFSGVVPTNTAYWIPFGASFENIATGFLFAEEAVIDNAVIRKLRTSETGKRIFVEQDSMSMFDDDGNLKMIVSGDTLSAAPSSSSYDISDEKGLADKDYSASKLASSFSEDIYYTLATINVKSATNVVKLPRLDVSSIFDATITSGFIRATVYTFWTIDGETKGSPVTTLSSVLDNSTQISGKGTLSEAGYNLSPGTHTIGIMNRVIIEPYGSTNSGGGIYISTASSGQISVVYPVQKTEVASNGFRAMFTSDYSFEASKSGSTDDTIIFRMVAGNYGIVAKNSGLYLKLGGSWYSATYATQSVRINSSSNTTLYYLKLTSTTSPI